MRIVCPCCQTDFPIEAGINDVNARAAVQRAFTLTPIGKLLLAYVQLFKPEKRAMTWGKAVKILDQLIPMIVEAKIEFKGRIWPAPQAYWEQAIEQMIDGREKLTLPLSSHGYLFKIISGYADKTEGKRESQAEARKQGGLSQRHREQPKTKAMPEETRQQLNKYLNKTITN
ncbi:MAG: hypothetical protein JNL77_03175 [Nitrosomonas sp.]|nr:hypothetical protein [Nitrosomonas sp.]